MPNLENQRILHFELQCQKLLRLYQNTYILLFCIDLSTKPYGVYDFTEHVSLFQNMFIKIYTDFFLSSGGYNFKINCLKETQNKSSYLADQFDVIPIAIEC